MTLYIGLMSGTSMDGVDAALVDVREHRLLAGITRPYSSEVKALLNQVVLEQSCDLAIYGTLNTLLGREFAEAVYDLKKISTIGFERVQAIGSHGQTLAHNAFAAVPYTLQLACPHTIAEATGLPVVADFRTRDIVLGGQGAPLAPLYHQALFSSKAHTNIAVVNIGGIANITYITPHRLIGYDVGPGNCLMDAWIHKVLQKAYDEHGAWAETGCVIDSLLERCLHDPYFSIPAPRSIGREYFSLDWLQKYCAQEQYAAHDIQASLLALTVISIAKDIKKSGLAIPELVLCGGGVHNKALVKGLQAALPQCVIHSSEDLGIHPDYLEAMMFAWLADKAIRNEPLDLKRITGARKPAVLGVIYS